MIHIAKNQCNTDAVIHIEIYITFQVIHMLLNMLLFCSINCNIKKVSSARLPIGHNHAVPFPEYLQMLTASN